MTPNLTDLSNAASLVLTKVALVDQDQQAAAAQLKTAQDALSAEQATSATLRLEIDNLNGQVASLSAPVVFDFLEFQTWHLGGGTVANSVGVTTAAVAKQTIPGIGFASRTLQPAGKGGNAYWYLTNGIFPQLKRHRYEASFCFQSAADAAAAQAVEFDKQQVVNNAVFNPALQADYAEGVWRIWDRATHEKTGAGWVSTGVPLKRPAPGVWTSIQLDWHRDDANVYYDRILVNGSGVGFKPVSFPAPTLKMGDMLNCGFQLDANAVGAAYTVLINRFRLTGWTA